MHLIYLSTLILAAVSGLFSVTRQLQMLQQNSYFLSRYAKWVGESYTVELAFCAVLYALSALLTAKGLFAVQLGLMAVFLAVRAADAVLRQKKAVKKLVATARIKRFYAAAVLLFVLLIAGYSAFPGQTAGKLCSFFCLLLAFASPLLAAAVRLLTAPVDRSVTGWYIRDAKRILREHKNLTVIGITGSYGKTTTKFILTRLLSEKYNVVATPQSFNTPMGVVRTIREKLQPQTQIFICEMGAKNVGDIREICDIVHPDYGIITSVGPQHLDTFQTVDRVFATKFELADAVRQKGGRVLVNGDSEELCRRLTANDCLRYGMGEDCAFRVEQLSYGRNGSAFTLSLGEERVPLTSRLLGRHNAVNVAGAAAMAHLLGVGAEELRFACSSLRATEHRLELKTYQNGSLLIDDAYNANPEGCLEAVRVLGSFEGMKKIMVTPGLVELGEREYDCNYALGLASAQVCDIMILVGQNRSKPMRDAAEAAGFDREQLYVVSSFREAAAIFDRLADSKTVILLENDLPDNYLN